MEFYKIYHDILGLYINNPLLMASVVLPMAVWVMIQRSIRISASKKPAEQIHAQNRLPDPIWLSSKPEGIIIGRARNHRYVRVPVERDAIYNGMIVGGAGSGKTTTLLMCSQIANAVADHPYTSLIVDPKREQYQTVPGINNLCLDPTDRSTWGWNPYYALDNLQHASSDVQMEVFGRIARCLIPEADPKQAFWVDNARCMLTGLLADGYSHNLDFIATVNDILTCNLQEKITKICTNAGTTQITLKYLAKFNKKKSEAMQDIETHLYTPLSIFANTDIQYFMQNNPNRASPAAITDEGKSLYLCVPEHKLHEYGSIFRVIIAQTLDELTKRAIGSTPCYVMIDEAYAIGKIDNLLEKLSIARGYGVSIWLSFQGLAQLREQYGRDGAQIIMDNCRIKCILESNDNDTSSYIIKTAGTYAQPKSSVSNGASGNTTVSYADRNIYDEADLISLVASKKEIVVTPTGTYLVSKNYWFKDRYFCRQQKLIKKSGNIIFRRK